MFPPWEYNVPTLGTIRSQPGNKCFALSRHRLSALVSWMFHISFLLQAVDDDGEGSVTCYVAGGAEGVHRDVEGDHERLGIRTEAQHATHWS